MKLKAKKENLKYIFKVHVGSELNQRPTSKNLHKKIKIKKIREVADQETIDPSRILSRVHFLTSRWTDRATASLSRDHVTVRRNHV